MFRVYTASKLSTAPIWNSICAESPHVIFHARWLKHNRIGTPDTQARSFWQENVDDIRIADALFVYALVDEHLRGALVEVGIALAFAIPVYAIGNHPDYGTWQYHPLVTIVPSIKAAIERLVQKDPLNASPHYAC